MVGGGEGWQWDQGFGVDVTGAGGGCPPKPHRADGSNGREVGAARCARCRPQHCSSSPCVTSDSGFNPPEASSSHAHLTGSSGDPDDRGGGRHHRVLPN